MLWHKGLWAAGREGSEDAGRFHTQESALSCSHTVALPSVGSGVGLWGYLSWGWGTSSQLTTAWLCDLRQATCLSELVSLIKGFGIEPGTW